MNDKRRIPINKDTVRFLLSDELTEEEYEGLAKKLKKSPADEENTGHVADALELYTGSLPDADSIQIPKAPEKKRTPEVQWHRFAAAAIVLASIATFIWLSPWQTQPRWQTAAVTSVEPDYMEIQGEQKTGKAQFITNNKNIVGFIQPKSVVRYTGPNSIRLVDGTVWLYKKPTTQTFHLDIAGYGIITIEGTALRVARRAKTISIDLYKGSIGLPGTTQSVPPLRSIRLKKTSSGWSQQVQPIPKNVRQVFQEWQTSGYTYSPGTIKKAVAKTKKPGPPKEFPNQVVLYSGVTIKCIIKKIDSENYILETKNGELVIPKSKVKSVDY